MTADRTVLFLCTGNYYRSRYAEICFNLAAPSGWRADSRGLRPTPANVGPISRSVLSRLDARGITRPAELRAPLPALPAELAAAARVIALDEDEHRPMMAEVLPGWEGRVEYWRIGDTPFMTVDDALTGIERAVDRLLDEIRRGA